MRRPKDIISLGTFVPSQYSAGVIAKELFKKVFPNDNQITAILGQHLETGSDGLYGSNPDFHYYNPRASPVTHIEVRAPSQYRTGLSTSIESWHIDNNNEDFDMISWSNIAPTEFAKMPDKGVENNISRIGFMRKEWHFTPEQIYVPKNNEVIVFNNVNYLHRRPAMSGATAIKRWFARIYLSKKYLRG